MCNGLINGLCDGHWLTQALVMVIGIGSLGGGRAADASE